MVELYKNNIIDLFLPPTRSSFKQFNPKLDIIEDISGCTYVNGATVSIYFLDLNLL